MDRVCKESRGKRCYRMWTWGPQAPSSSSLGLLSSPSPRIYTPCAEPAGFPFRTKAQLNNVSLASLQAPQASCPFIS